MYLTWCLLILKNRINSAHALFFDLDYSFNNNDWHLFQVVGLYTT